MSATEALRPILRIAVPGPQLDALRILKAVGHSNLYEIPVLRRGHYPESRVTILGVAFSQIPLSSVEVSREAEVKALGLEVISEGPDRIRWGSREQARDKPVEVLRQVKAKLGVEVQRRLQVERHRTARKDIVQRERSMNGPLGGTRGSFDGATPLDQPALLANVDLLFYPHLEDTVERLQVRRVLKRMREFIRLMHEGLGATSAEGSRLNVGREILELAGDLPALEHILETAFPVTVAQMHGTRRPSAVTQKVTDQRLTRFSDIAAGKIGSVSVDWEPVRETHVIFGTARLVTGRRQPFALYLQSLGEHLVVRCISPVGQVEVGSRLDFVTDLVTRVRTQVGAIEDAAGSGYDLTIEEEVLLGTPDLDRERIGWLVARVVNDADLLERSIWPEQDAALSEFKDDLADEGRVVSHGKD